MIFCAAPVKPETIASTIQPPIQNHVHVFLDGKQIFEAVQKQAVRNMRAGGPGAPGIASL